MDIEKNMYAILDGPWKEEADSECKRSWEHEKNVRKIRKQIGKELGLKVHGHVNRYGFGHGKTALGVYIDKIEKTDAKSRGLKILKTAPGTKMGLIAVAPYRQKKMQWFQDLLHKMSDDGFASFLSGYKKFPFGCEIIGLQFYVPYVWHCLERCKEPRTAVAIGHDKDREFEPAGLPEGVHLVTRDDANAWLNGKCELELA